MQTKTEPNIWLFDIDGVLTSPQKKIVPQELIKIISSQIKSGDSVAFVTGRSFNWTIENIISKLKNELKETDFKRVFISAEKGGVWSYYQGGEWVVHIDKRLAPPGNLAEKVNQLVKNKFSKIMFIDKKETMISVEMQNDATLNNFASEQKKLDKTLRQYIEGFNLLGEFEMDSTLIATDIQHKNSGKGLGASRVLDWAKSKNATFKHFFAFGDTKGDIAMAQTLHEEGHDITFIFTGKKEALEGEKLSFSCKIFDSQYNSGTLKFLQTIKGA